MKIAFECKKCGSSEFYDKEGFRICSYCDAKYTIKRSEVARKSSRVSVNDDVERLLQRIKEEPSNAKRLANLILDIDPHNKEARKYL